MSSVTASTSFLASSGCSLSSPSSNTGVKVERKVVRAMECGSRYAYDRQNQRPKSFISLYLEAIAIDSPNCPNRRWSEIHLGQLLSPTGPQSKESLHEYVSCTPSQSNGKL